LAQHKASAEIFLREGAVPGKGTLIKQPELARTLTRIAEKGFDGFYEGKVASKLVEGVTKAGGIWSLQDLKDYRVVERKPLVGNYRGMKITTVGPPSSGGIALLTILNILSGYDLDTLASYKRKHLVIEAMRRAYRDRAIYLGDPAFVDIPVEKLIHPFYADGLRASINPDNATPSTSLPGIDTFEKQSLHTTHLSIVDDEGNRVSSTMTINLPFGSCLVIPGTGVLLNDEMDDFSSKPGTPNAYGLVGNEANAIAPGKRPLSSMTPVFLEKDGRIAILGTPGGSRIISMAMLAALEFFSGSTVESIVAHPRYHHQYLPDVVQYEPRALSEDESDNLQLMGHTLKRLTSPYGDEHASYGNMHAVILDKTSGTAEAASDPRGEGMAVALPDRVQAK
jgi:gamma-glutamyltranspeptidase/glutathione hydrolase